jgi:hypothetical protein
MPEWDFQRKRQLVEALLACACLQTPPSHNQLMQALPDKISQRVQRFASAREEVMSLVDACLAFADGLAELLKVIEFYEGPSLAWQQVQATVNATAPTPPASSATPTPQVNKPLFDQIVAALLPQMNDAHERKALIIAALHGSPLLQQLTWEGPSRAFTIHLVRKLEAYGEIAPGRPALVALLEAARDEVGLGYQAEFDRLIAQLLQGKPKP